MRPGNAGVSPAGRMRNRIALHMRAFEFLCRAPYPTGRSPKALCSQYTQSDACPPDMTFRSLPSSSRSNSVLANRVLLALPGRAVRYSRSASTNRRGAWPSGLTSLGGHSFHSPRIYSSSSMNPRARMSAGSSSFHPRADRSGGGARGARGPGGRVHPEPAGGLRLRGRARRREPLHRPSPARLLRAGGRGGRGVVQQGEFI